MEQKDEFQKLRSRIEVLEGKMNQLLPFEKPEPEERKAYHHRNQMIYNRLDPMSTQDLKKVRSVVSKNYRALFDAKGALKDNRAAKLERLYATIDNRIVENLKLWR